MSEKLKRALIVSPYFLPCNLAGVHRPKLLARGLPEFGWEPIVLTVHPRYYGSLAESGFAKLIPPDLRLEYVDAIPAAVSGLAGIGDLSLRAFWTMRRRIRDLVRRGDVDLIFVSVLPGYAGLHGGWAKRRFGLPFVLDYQDPWVSDWGAIQPRFSKSGMAHRLAKMLEPRFAPFADAVTAVSNGTLDSLRRRGLLRSETPTVELPIGSDPHDHAVAAQSGKSYFARKEGMFNLAFLGTVPEKKLGAIRAFLRALGKNDPGEGFRLYLIGTSGQAQGEDSIGIREMAAECEVGDCVIIEPRRLPYLDALRTMQEADALLMLGSTESHYTASKLFPYWLAERPIVGMSHESSTVADLSRELGGVHLCTYAGESDVDQAGEKLLRVVASLRTGNHELIPARNAEAFEPYSARGLARAYAKIFNDAFGSH